MFERFLVSVTALLVVVAACPSPAVLAPSPKRDSASTWTRNYDVPGTWRRYGNTRSLQERVSISRKGIDAILPQLDKTKAEFQGIGWWQSGNVYSAMANHDYYAKTKTYKDVVINNLNLAFKRSVNFDPYGWWATSAAYAFRAYQDKNVLQHAIDTWQHVSRYVITKNDVNSGATIKKVNYDGVHTKCNGVSMAGAVLWRPQGSLSTNSITTGLYMTLSAWLADATKDPKYKDAAILSATWIKNHNIEDDIVLDSINTQNCGKTLWKFTYNNGKYIEGLAVLAKYTGDAQWLNLMYDIIGKTVISGPWQGKDGIITEGNKVDKNDDGVAFKAVYIRGLNEALTRWRSNKYLGTLLHSYIDVQYNALLDLASKGHIYSNNWEGPKPGKLTTWGQLAALDVLVSAINAN